MRRGALLTMPIRFQGLLRASLLFAATCAVVAPPALAEDGIRTQRVQFAKGASSATVNGSIKIRKD